MKQWLAAVLMVLALDLLLTNVLLKEVPELGIIVLGGGLTSTGDCPPHTILRLKKAIQIYYRYKDKFRPVIIPLSGGTPYKPNPTDTRGFPIWESSAAAKYLINAGISANDILEESYSLDTVGNVITVSYYCLCFLTISLPGLFSSHDSYRAQRNQTTHCDHQ